jgi:WbqC-like protein
MIVAAHQPSYLPWLGYFDKLAKVDMFVVMDELPYEARSFQNRNRIKCDAGPAWLTVPVQRDVGPRICDQLVDNTAKGNDTWQRRTWMTIVNHYRRAPYLPRYMDDLRFLFTQPWKRLIDLDLYILDLGRRWFGIRTEVVRASELGLRSDGDLTDTLIDMCKKVGADHYLSGNGSALRTLDSERMGRAGIGVCWQIFDHPTYPQRHPEQGFMPQLSFLDLLFNCGEGSRDLLFGRGHPIHAHARAA